MSIKKVKSCFWQSLYTLENEIIFILHLLKIMLTEKESKKSPFGRMPFGSLHVIPEKTKT